MITIESVKEQYVKVGETLNLQVPPVYAHIEFDVRTKPPCRYEVYVKEDGSYTVVNTSGFGCDPVGKIGGWTIND